MKNILQFISVGLIFIFFTDSCTIEKRKYTSGYNVEWRRSKTKESKKESVDNDMHSKANEKTVTPAAENTIINSEPSFASTNNIDFISSQKTTKTIDSIDVSKKDCDLIILKSGEEINAKVIEISKEEIKYKKCEDKSGLNYAVKKSEVFEIKYPNGTKDLIAQETPVEKANKPIEKEDSGIFGILAIALFVAGFAVPLLFIPSLVFAIIGMEKKRKHRGLAIATLALFGLSVILLFLLILAYD